MQTKPDLTIVIPVKNEEKNLKGCLDAIGKDFARHIVLVDSASSDTTLAIATDYNLEIINFQWNGQFPKKETGI